METNNIKIAYDPKFLSKEEIAKSDKKKMEVYTCDSVSYVICRNLAFLMLDLETSGLLYSAMFCTNQKNAFLICKSSVFIPYYQSYSPEK